MMAQDGFEDREAAWMELEQCLSIQVNDLKRDWPDDLPEREERARTYLQENPATPGTKVSLQLSTESMEDLARLLDTRLEAALGYTTTTPDPSVGQDLIIEPYSSEESFLAEPDVQVTVVESAELDAEPEPEIVPRSPVSTEPLPPETPGVEVWEGADEHNCRAELDVDDICLVCGRHVPTGPGAVRA